MIMLSPFWSEYSLDHHVFVPGRAQRLMLQLGSTKIKVHNVHNFALSRVEVLSVVRSLEEDYNRDLVNPDLEGTLALGDWNYLAPHNLPKNISTLWAQRSPDNINYSASHWRLWEEALSLFTELEQPLPSRFSVSTLEARRIDRIYISTSKSLLLKCEVSCQVLVSPETLYYRYISDHSPVFLVMQYRKQQAHKELPIPKAWCEHPEFARVANVLCELILEEADLEAFERLRLHKKVLCIAFSCARCDAIL